MPRRGGRDRWKPRKVPPPAPRPSFVVEPTRVFDVRGPAPPTKDDEPVLPPGWMKPGVLVNYHPIRHPNMAKGVPSLRHVRVVSLPFYPGGRDWLVKINRKRHPVPTWTLELVSEGEGTVRSLDAAYPCSPASVATAAAR